MSDSTLQTARERQERWKDAPGWASYRVVHTASGKGRSFLEPDELHVPQDGYHIEPRPTESEINLFQIVAQLKSDLSEADELGFIKTQRIVKQKRKIAELEAQVRALMEIPIDMHDGVALTVGDTREAIALLKKYKDKGDEGEDGVGDEHE
jgi:hypothetical protein